MDELLNRFMEELKKDNKENSDIKDYILLVKRYLDRFKECYEDNETDEKITKEFLEDFEDKENDNWKRTNNTTLLMSEYLACKKLIKTVEEAKGKDSKDGSDKVKQLGKALEMAANFESKKGFEDLSNKYSLNPSEEIAYLMRKVIRRISGKPNMNSFIKEIKIRKQELEDELRPALVESIGKNVLFLNEYGIIDKLIDETNGELEKQGLSKLKVLKRYWIPDEYGDKKGNFVRYGKDGVLRKYDKKNRIVSDGENLEDYLVDIGVIDSFDEEYINNPDAINKQGKENPSKVYLTVEDLYMLDSFWREQYIQEKLKLHNAIFAIKYANLWKTLFSGDEKDIAKIDDLALKNAYKRENAISYLCSFQGRIPGKVKAQYANFLQKNNLPKYGKLEDEVSRHRKYIDNINETIQGVYLQQDYILSNLLSNDFEGYEWGTINEGSKNEAGEPFETIVIKNPKFRGPLVFTIPENWTEHFFGKKKLDLPKFNNGEINETIEILASKLYFPVSPYYNKTIRDELKNNPKSEILQELAHNLERDEIQEL